MKEIRYVFRNAEAKDRDEIFKLYRAAIGTEGCTWSEDYPNNEIFMADLKRKDIFCMENEAGDIIGAISVDDDEVINSLDCWNKSSGKMAELARLVIRQDYQNNGLAPKLIMDTVDVLRKRGYRTVHYLVSKHNKKARSSYKKLNFKKVGESDILDNDWLCYEMNIEPEKNYSWFTIPNLLSIFRLVLAFAFLNFYNPHGDAYDNISSIAILVFSGLTDFLDGKIARKYNMISEVGKVIDPLADKVTELIIAICLIRKYKLIILLLVVILVKEILMAVGGYIVIGKIGINDGAKWYGKVSTFTFYIIMVVLLIAPKMNTLIANSLIVFCSATLMFAFVMYIKYYIGLLRENKVNE